MALLCSLNKPIPAKHLLQDLMKVVNTTKFFKKHLIKFSYNPVINELYCAHIAGKNTGTREVKHFSARHSASKEFNLDFNPGVLL